MKIAACGCSSIGSSSSTCDFSGKCPCKVGYTGKKCDQCQNGYSKDRSGACKSCQCNSNGSVSLNCNSNGRCSCKSGYTADKCNQCVSGYFGFPTCRSCQCNQQGSVNLTCDAKGKCSCKKGYSGDKCDKCPNNFCSTDLHSDRIVFSAIKKSGKYYNGLITYDQVPINVGSGMNGGSGTFVAPRTDFYVFSASALSSNPGHLIISVLKNGRCMLKIADGRVKSKNNIAYNWIDHLKKGDTLKLTITGHYLYTDSDDFVFFNGYSLVIDIFVHFQKLIKLHILG